MTYSDALVEDLSKVAADAMGWDWPAVPAEHIPSPAECTTDVVEAILDRLVELGWRENCGVVTRGGDPAVCALPCGHQDQRHADGNGVTWGACDLDRRADALPEMLTFRLGPAPRTGVRAE